jgi:hypothetical protein
VADSPVRWGILGTGGIEVDRGFRAPGTVTLIPRKGDPVRVESVRVGRGLRDEAVEVAGRLAGGEAESPLMPPDETILIMETLGTVLAQVRGNR